MSTNLTGSETPCRKTILTKTCRVRSISSRWRSQRWTEGTAPPPDRRPVGRPPDDETAEPPTPQLCELLSKVAGAQLEVPDVYLTRRQQLWRKPPTGLPDRGPIKGYAMKAIQKVSSVMLGIAILVSFGCEPPTGLASTAQELPSFALSAGDGFVVSRFDGFFAETSPCDGMFYTVSGTLRVGVRERVLASGAEDVALGFLFTGQTAEYSVLYSGEARFEEIADVYDMTSRSAWIGRGPLPDFETFSSGTVTVSNGTPVGLRLSTDSNRCIG